MHLLDADLYSFRFVDRTVSFSDKVELTDLAGIDPRFVCFAFVPTDGRPLLRNPPCDFSEGREQKTPHVPVGTPIYHIQVDRRSSS